MAAGTPPAPAAPAVTTPATGDDQQLGAAGQRALETERQARRDAEARAQTLEQERDALRTATQTDQEKALDAAVKAATADERSKWQAHICGAEVRSSLRAAGVANEKTLALALQAPEFSKLKVGDDGAVERLADTVTQFKKDYPELFAAAAPAAAPAPGPGGAWDGSAGGGRPQPASLEDAVSAHYSKKT